MVSQSQSESVNIKGRFIVDNILLVQELIGGYHSDDFPPRCAIKVDIS